MKKPLIFDFCTPIRSENVKTVYCYDFDKNLNVVNLKGKAVPFVDYGTNAADNKSIVEFDTITKVSREGNDEDNRMMSDLLEFETTTRVFREGSDLDLNVELFELATKTAVKRESDDE